jgi:hypothetical protein
VRVNALSGLEGAYQNPELFRAFCRRFRKEHQVRDSQFVNWHLEPAEPFDLPSCVVDCDFEGSLSSDCAQSPDWVWEDPFADCSYALGDGLAIQAANGRDLWYLNLSAPRLMQPAPEGTDWVVQTVCGVVSDPAIGGQNPSIDGRPAIGGLLLWKDEENYLRLERGRASAQEISFAGCLDNQDVIIGRGRLAFESSGRVSLRLERVSDRVRALCSADGEAWFSVGEVGFPDDGGVLQVGMYAIGMIDRTIYHGAYPDGTAIRFESFTLWGI